MNTRVDPHSFRGNQVNGEWVALSDEFYDLFEVGDDDSLLAALALLESVDVGPGEQVSVPWRFTFEDDVEEALIIWMALSTDGDSVPLPDVPFAFLRMEFTAVDVSPAAEVEDEVDETDENGTDEDPVVTDENGTETDGGDADADQTGTGDGTDESGTDGSPAGSTTGTGAELAATGQNLTGQAAAGLLLLALGGLAVLATVRRRTAAAWRV